MKRIITAIIASILVVMTAATLSGCKNENAPLTGTKVYKFAESGDSSKNLPYKVSFKVGDAKKKISEIWVNIDNMKLETTFKANAVTSSSWTEKKSYKTFTSRPITKEEVSKAKDDYGWIALGFDSKWQNVSATQYVSVDIVGECSVNEIVFVDTDGKRMTVEINMVNYWSLSDKKEPPQNVIVYDKESDEKSSPKFLIDEQEKFEKRPKKG